MILPVIPLNEMEGVRLFVNQAKNDTALSLNFGIRPPESNNVSYRDLFIVLRDINEFTGEIAGIASWFIRDKTSLKFQFDQPATIEINANKKVYRFETKDDLTIAIKIKKGLMKEDPQVVFSLLPVAVGV